MYELPHLRRPSAVTCLTHKLCSKEYDYMKKQTEHNTVCDLKRSLKVTRKLPARSRLCIACQTLREGREVCGLITTGCKGEVLVEALVYDLDLARVEDDFMRHGEGLSFSHSLHRGCQCQFYLSYMQGELQLSPDKDGKSQG